METFIPTGGCKHSIFEAQPNKVLNSTHENFKSDVWLTVHRNSMWIRKTNQMSLFVFFISLLIVAQHVSGNHVPIIRS
jgi:hypothetical protein